MGKNAITDEWHLSIFKKKIPKDLGWEMAPPNSDPFHEPLEINERTYPN